MGDSFEHIRSSATGSGVRDEEASKPMHALVRDADGGAVLRGSLADDAHRQRLHVPSVRDDAVIGGRRSSVDLSEAACVPSAELGYKRALS